MALLRRPLARAALAALLLALGCGGRVESRMAEVRALQGVGQFAASIEELTDVLAVEPDLPEANYRLGLALVQTGEPSRAVWPLEKAAESDDYAISAGILLASTHFQTRNYDEAVRAAGAVLARDPQRLAALRVRASANLAARKAEAALEDTRRLVALRPDDYGVRSLHATVLADLGHDDDAMREEARREHQRLKRMGEQSGDPLLRQRACLMPASFADDVEDDAEEARRLYEECAALEPTDTAVVNHLAGFFQRSGEPERATALWRQAIETAPEKLILRQALAERLQSRGETDEAERVLREAVDRFDSAEAWNLLASFYRVQQRPDPALEALEEVIERSGDDAEAALFAKADVLIDLGRLDDAREIADALEQRTYGRLLRGRIHLLSGEPRRALEELDAGVRAWPNNAAARYLTGIAARRTGDYERAISEFREAVRANNRETEAALELARIYLDVGQFYLAVAFADAFVRGHGSGRAEPFVIAARALGAAHDIERSRNAIEGLEQAGFPALALRERMLLERRQGGPEVAIAIADASGYDLTDPQHLELLGAVVDALVAARRADDAVARIDTALERSPDQLRLHELRALALAAAGRRAEAQATFERVLEQQPRSANALAGLASLRAADGRAEEAIALFDRAYALAPQQGEYAYSAAQLVLASGDRDGAAERLRHVIDFHPGIAGARNDMAWLLAERGDDLDLALKLVSDARRMDSTAAVLDTAGWVHYRRDEFDEAAMMLEVAVAQAPADPAMHYRFALALEKAGQHERAREMLEKAISLGSFPEIEDARRHLAELADGAGTDS